MNLDEVRQEIEGVASLDFFNSDSEDLRNSVRILLASMYIGTNADKIARFLGLNRDKFVRPRARRLRDNGVWEGDKVTVCWDEDKADTILMAILLDAMVAEGELVRRPGPDSPDTSSPAGSDSPPPPPG